MRKKIFLFGMMAIILFALTGCGTSNKNIAESNVFQQEIDLTNADEFTESALENEDDVQTKKVRMRVINDFSDIAITEIYTSISDTNEWNDNSLEGQTIAKDESADILIDVPVNGEKVDIYVVDEDENETEFFKLDFSSVNQEEGGTITLSGENMANIE